jgi:transcriptional regulator with GAF, ATPase, and Fis domain
MREQIEGDILTPDQYSKVRILEQLSEDEQVWMVAQSLGAKDSSCLAMYVALEGKHLGVLAVFNDEGKQYSPEDAQLFGLLNEPFAVALANCLKHRELREYKDLLADHNEYLQDEIRSLVGEEIIGADFGLKGVMDLVRQVAPLSSPVLLMGETGTGKEVIAKAIHKSSLRRDGPFIKVNCGAIPDTLIDSELFGHEKGAFTGALSKKRGRFERAHNGTIFLDEIGELPPAAQVRLLRVLQDKEIERVGGSRPIPVNIRIIAATHRDLLGMLKEGSFREDLYFRIKVFPIAIPPLMGRKNDIPALVYHFIQKKSREMGLSGTPNLSPGALDSLMAYDWPGNVRELENAVERALILSKGDTLIFPDLEQPRVDDKGANVHIEEKALNLDAAMAEHIRTALKMTNGRVDGDRGAAKLLGINPRTLRHRMKKLGVPFGRKAKAELQN